MTNTQKPGLVSASMLADAAMSNGAPRRLAISQVVKRDPELHKAYLDAHNGRASVRPSRPAKKVEPVNAKLIHDPQAAWDQAVSAAVESGLTKQKAVSDVVKNQPDVHRAFVAASNAK